MAVASSSSSGARSDCSKLYRPRKPSTTKPFPSPGFVSSAPVLPLRSLSASARNVRVSDSRRSASPRTMISAATTTTTQQSERKSSAKRTCLCSRSSNPSSFQCSLHRNQQRHGGDGATTSRSSGSGLNLRRLAMANSLLRIGAEGNLVRRVMSSMVRMSMPEKSSRGTFRPRPSRLSAVSDCEDS